MTGKVDLYNSTYSHFEAEVLARIRRKTYVEDFGQNSWTTAPEYRHWAEQLGLAEHSHVLEIATGSGGPAIFLARLSGCRITGIDINAHGIATATQQAQVAGIADRIAFRAVDAAGPLPFAEGSFDALLCVDSANHFSNRAQVLTEWHRVLKPGGLALFTDPVVVTGLVSNEEFAMRSAIGYFLFAPPGVNETLLETAGFELLRREDVTENAALVSKRWHDARAEDRDALLKIEGEERYTGLQQFLAMVHRVTSERRLSRVAYLARKRG